MKLGFEELYSEIERNNISKFEEVEKKAKEESKKNMMISIIICVVLDIVLFIALNSGLMTLLPIAVVDLIVFVIINLVFSKNQREYTRLFKENVIGSLFGNFYDDLIYEPAGSISKYTYNEGRYDEYYNRYKSEDHMQGKIDNKYHIEMAEVKTEKEETERDSNGNTRTRTYTIFHGLFAKIQMEKSLQTSLQIRDNYDTSRGERVRMDSAMFEKYFDVASDNKIITMQVLTHDVMEMLMDFQNNSKIKFDISIYGDKMYLRFNTRDMFELKSLKKGAFDKEMLKKYYDVLDFTYTLSRKIIELIEEAKI